MTPAARVAAAIEVLDAHLAGRSAEQALSNWARASRFAGSKDRAALRDLVFDALRRRASCAVLGGGLTGRGLMIGLGAQHGWDMPEIFSGQGHAPGALTPDEAALLASPPTLSDAQTADMPDWLWPLWQRDLGDQAEPAASTLRDRAAMFLRVNTRRGTLTQAQDSLAGEQITTTPHARVDTCLQVTSNERRVKLSQAYTTGLIEIQDASSQAAIAALDIAAGARVLDYCAGGGGKALAIADRFDCTVTAHDVAPGRMKDLGPRADRAGVTIKTATTQDLANSDPFDVVVIDAPCSGSGTWRRNPEAKWNFTKNKLIDFADLQFQVVSEGHKLVRPGGLLIYMTCSVFHDENQAVVGKASAAGLGSIAAPKLVLFPDQTHDGFFCQGLTAP